MIISIYKKLNIFSISLKLFTYLILVIFLFSRCATASDSFRLYEDIGQVGKPSLTKYNINSVRAIPEKTFWPKGTQDFSKPDYNYVEKIAKLPIFSTDIICLNIEQWPLYKADPHVIDKRINYLSKIASIIKKYQPDSHIGYYGILPIRNYYAPLRNRKPELDEWHNQNKYLEKLANELDVIYPSLYAFQNNKEAWKKYAIANIQQARKYNKPVIAFLWPQYHGSNRHLGYKFIDGEFWRTQLETVYQHADGAIIWTPWGRQKTKWNPDSEWVKETIKFAEEKLLK